MYVISLVIMQASVLNMHWVLTGKVLSFNFNIILYMKLMVIQKTVGVVLEILEVDIREIIVMHMGLLNMGTGVYRAMLYLGDLLQETLM